MNNSQSNHHFPSLEQEEFNQLIEPLGPWGPDRPQMPPIAVAVSGGADSLCLCLLASRWRSNVIALIVDHGLRHNSAEEAKCVAQQLRDLSIPSKILTLEKLNPGSAVEERARIARYQALFSACCELGCVDLLLGHHAGDQAETVLMRIRAGSGEDGLAAMAQITELLEIRLVRPLLTIAPQRLRATLRKENISWVEDPSNQDQHIQRNRLRKELALGWGKAGMVSMLLHRAQEESQKRMDRDCIQAEMIASLVQLRSEGFAILPKKGLDARALGALIRTISGSVYTPLRKSVETLARNMRPVTLGGIQIIPAGRMGEGWLMIREASAIESPQPVVRDMIWDQRFKIIGAKQEFDKELQIGALGADYKQFSDRQGLPASILKTLPAIRHQQKLLAVPHLKICLDSKLCDWKIIFQPRQAATQSYLFSVLPV